jgi:hypothetical protein
MMMKKKGLECGWVPLYTGKPTKMVENHTKSDKELEKWGEWVRPVNRHVNWKGKWMAYVITMSQCAPVGRTLS